MNLLETRGKTVKHLNSVWKKKKTRKSQHTAITLALLSSLRIPSNENLSLRKMSESRFICEAETWPLTYRQTNDRTNDKIASKSFPSLFGAPCNNNFSASSVTCRPTPTRRDSFWMNCNKRRQAASTIPPTQSAKETRSTRKEWNIFNIFRFCTRLVLDIVRNYTIWTCWHAFGSGNFTFYRLFSLSLSTFRDLNWKEWDAFSQNDEEYLYAPPPHGDYAISPFRPFRIILLPFVRVAELPAASYQLVGVNVFQINLHAAPNINRFVRFRLHSPWAF